MSRCPGRRHPSPDEPGGVYVYVDDLDALHAELEVVDLNGYRLAFGEFIP